MKLSRKEFDAWLAAYPVRVAERWAEEDGRVVLEVEKAAHPVAERLLALLRGPAAARAVLDAVGSDAWRLADGTRSVAEIAERLRERHGAAAEPAPNRAIAFFSALRDRRLVAVRPSAWSEAAPPATGFPAEAGYRDATCGRCSGTTRLRGGPGTRYRCPHCRRIARAP